MVDGRIRVTDNVTTTNSPRALYAENGTRVPLVVGKIYIATFEVVNPINISSVLFKANCDTNGNHATFIGTSNVLGAGRVSFIFIPTDPYRSFICITSSGSAEGCSFDISYFDLKELTAIYPIANYLGSCRTNAQRLPYGLQTSGFKRDSLGRILSKSNFLEADGVGYGNTGYISPLEVVPESFEVIIEKPRIITTGTNNKYVCGGASPGDMVVEIGAGSDTVGYVRLRKVGRGFGSAQWLPTNTMLTTLVCDGTNVYVYFNGVWINTYVAQPYTSSNPIKLMAEHAVSNQIIEGRLMNQAGLRLFKVHKKALTQEEITKNFNKYQAQGLLNE